MKLDDQPYADLTSLRVARDREDDHMIDLTSRYNDADLEAMISYRTIAQPADTKTPLHLCWLHLFNHQTHHRGQIHDQLSQHGMSPPLLDLIYYLREAS